MCNRWFENVLIRSSKCNLPVMYLCFYYAPFSSLFPILSLLFIPSLFCIFIQRWKTLKKAIQLISSFLISYLYFFYFLSIFYFLFLFSCLLSTIIFLHYSYSFFLYLLYFHPPFHLLFGSCGPFMLFPSHFPFSFISSSHPHPSLHFLWSQCRSFYFVSSFCCVGKKVTSGRRVKFVRLEVTSSSSPPFLRFSSFFSFPSLSSHFVFSFVAFVGVFTALPPFCCSRKTQYSPVGQLSPDKNTVRAELRSGKMAGKICRHWGYEGNFFA